MSIAASEFCALFPGSLRSYSYHPYFPFLKSFQKLLPNPWPCGTLHFILQFFLCAVGPMCEIKGYKVKVKLSMCTRRRCRGQGMRGTLPPLPNTLSCRGAHFKKARGNFAFNFIWGNWISECNLCYSSGVRNGGFNSYKITGNEMTAVITDLHRKLTSDAKFFVSVFHVHVSCSTFGCNLRGAHGGLQHGRVQPVTNVSFGEHR